MMQAKQGEKFGVSVTWRGEGSPKEFINGGLHELCVAYAEFLAGLVDAEEAAAVPHGTFVLEERLRATARSWLLMSGYRER